MTQVIKTYISENAITVASSSLPTPVIANIPVIHGVKFTWSLTTDIRPYLWTYRYRVAGGDWVPADPDFTDTVNNTVDIFLTKAQADADPTSLIEIEVKSTDGVDFGTLATDSGTTLAGSVNAGDMVAVSIATADIALLAVDTGQIAADAITGAKIEDDAVDSEHITAGAVDLAHMSANSVDSDQYVDGSIDTAHIAADQITGALIADDQVDSEHYVALSIDNEHIANTTIEVGKLASSSTLRMFDTNGRAYLDRVLYNDANVNVPVNSLAASDRIAIFVGTNKNVTLNATSIKTDLALNNVENKSGATILTDELDAATLLIEVPTAVLTTNLAASINALAADTIGPSQFNAITDAAKIAITSQQFNADGNLITGVRSGADIRTAADIIASMDVDGNSLLWDPTSWKAGTDTADIPGGNIDASAQFVSSGEKTAIGYLDGNVHTDGANKIGVYDSTAAATVSAARLYNKTTGRRFLGGEEKIDPTGVTAFDQINHTGTGGDVIVMRKAMIFCLGDTTVYFGGRMRSPDNTNDGVVKLLVYDSSGVLKDTGATVGMAGAFADVECSADVSTSTTGFSDGDNFYVDVVLNDDAADTIDIEQYGFSIADS